jgi:hypothetical protein
VIYSLDGFYKKADVLERLKRLNLHIGICFLLWDFLNIWEFIFEFIDEILLFAGWEPVYIFNQPVPLDRGLG